jgi:hypothetical protein
MKNVILILVILLFISCEVVNPPPNDNILDPDFNNYANPVPEDLEIQTINENTIKFKWNYYYSNNFEGFRVVSEGTDHNYFKEIFTVNNSEVISGLEEEKNYTLKVQAYSDNVFTGFSDMIEITYNDYPSVTLNKNIFKFDKPIHNFSLGKQGTYLAIDNNDIEIYSMPNSGIFKKEKTISSAFKYFFFSNYDQHFLLTNLQSQLEIWDTKSWENVKTISDIQVEKYDQHPFNNTIAFSNQREVNILEIPVGQIIKTLILPSNVSTLRFSDDGNYLIVGTTMSEIKVFETLTWSEYKSINISNPTSEILSVDMSSFNDYLVYTVEKKLEVVDLKNNSIVMTYSNLDNNIIKYAYFTNNPDIIVLANGNKIDLLYIDTNENVNSIITTELIITKFSVMNKINNEFIISGDPLTTFQIIFNDFGSWEKVDSSTMNNTK